MLEFVVGGRAVGKTYGVRDVKISDIGNDWELVK